MAVTPTTKRLTAEEYFALDYAALDLPERHTQLVNGEIVVNQPNWRHQEIASEIFALIREWCLAGTARGRASMPVDVQLAEGEVYAPDVLWVNEAHRPPRDARRLYAPPDLAVEVRSPSTWQFDLGTKKRVYEAKGLPELWLVDTNSDTVLVYRRSSPSGTAFDVSLELERGEQLTTPLMPGLSIDLEELFDR